MKRAGTECSRARGAGPERLAERGAVFPWHWAAALVAAQPDLRVILAGGLTPENVREAVRVVQPFGVEVTSGVEQRPGEKDQTRPRHFVEAARSA